MYYIPGRPIEGLRKMDCHVHRILTRTQPNKKRARPELSDQYRYICQSVLMDYIDDCQRKYGISPRIVRFEISPGCFENIIANLPDTEFDFEDFKVLYHMGWDEENSFQDHKYPLCLKAFHSKKYEYQVNFAEAFKICRDFLRIYDKTAKMEVESLIAQNIEPAMFISNIHYMTSTVPN